MGELRLQQLSLWFIESDAPPHHGHSKQQQLSFAHAKLMRKKWESLGMRSVMAAAASLLTSVQLSQMCMDEEEKGIKR